MQNKNKTEIYIWKKDPQPNPVRPEMGVEQSYLWKRPICLYNHSDRLLLSESICRVSSEYESNPSSSDWVNGQWIVTPSKVKISLQFSFLSFDHKAWLWTIIFCQVLAYSAEQRISSVQHWMTKVKPLTWEIRTVNSLSKMNYKRFVVLETVHTLELYY